MSDDGGAAEGEGTRFLGIDPGTAVTGYGVVTRGGGGEVSLVECGVVRTSSGEPLPARIREIYEEVLTLIERFRPAAVAVEDVFQGKNARSALTLGHARGAILLAAALSDVAIAEYNPMQIKKAVVGTGRATKEQVAFMVQKRLRLRDAPAPSDAADGVAAALCHCLSAPLEGLGGGGGEGADRNVAEGFPGAGVPGPGEARPRAGGLPGGGVPGPGESR